MRGQTLATLIGSFVTGMAVMYILSRSSGLIANANPAPIHNGIRSEIDADLDEVALQEMKHCVVQVRIDYEDRFFVNNIECPEPLTLINQLNIAISNQVNCRVVELNVERKGGRNYANQNQVAIEEFCVGHCLILLERIPVGITSRSGYNPYRFLVL